VGWDQIWCDKIQDGTRTVKSLSIQVCCMSSKVSHIVLNFSLTISSNSDKHISGLYNKNIWLIEVGVKTIAPSPQL
jgi:hypothetical protein